VSISQLPGLALSVIAKSIHELAPDICLLLRSSPSADMPDTSRGTAQSRPDTAYPSPPQSRQDTRCQQPSSTPLNGGPTNFCDYVADFRLVLRLPGLGADFPASVLCCGLGPPGRLGDCSNNLFGFGLLPILSPNPRHRALPRRRVYPRTGSKYLSPSRAFDLRSFPIHPSSNCTSQT
jgi:hypothetical protein